MNVIISSGLESIQLSPTPDRPTAMFSEPQIIARILEFTGYTIDDVVNNPVARNAVRGYYGLYRYIEARCELIGDRSAPG